MNIFVGGEERVAMVERMRGEEEEEEAAPLLLLLAFCFLVGLRRCCLDLFLLSSSRWFRSKCIVLAVLTLERLCVDVRSYRL